jgi:hypothetical protein
MTGTLPAHDRHITGTWPDTSSKKTVKNRWHKRFEMRWYWQTQEPASRHAAAPHVAIIQALQALIRQLEYMPRWTDEKDRKAPSCPRFRQLAASWIIRLVPATRRALSRGSSTCTQKYCALSRADDIFSEALHHIRFIHKTPSNIIIKHYMLKLKNCIVRNTTKETYIFSEWLKMKFIHSLKLHLMTHDVSLFF